MIIKTVLYRSMQGFQAAANIALDLDVRPMPKGPLFPRWVLRSFEYDPCSSSTHLHVLFYILAVAVAEIALKLLRHLQLHDTFNPPPSHFILTTYTIATSRIFRLSYLLQRALA